jgi:hypothetical protein
MALSSARSAVILTHSGLAESAHLFAGIEEKVTASISADGTGAAAAIFSYTITLEKNA